MNDQSTRPAISPLRQRMLEDMTNRQFGEHTKCDYIRQVREFAAFFRPVTRSGRAVGSAALPTPSGLTRRELYEDEPGGHG